MRNLMTFCVVLLLAGPSYAVVIPTADSADPINPQHIEATGFLTGGPDAWGLGSTVRLGISQDLDFAIRLGALVVDRGNFQVKTENAKDSDWRTGFEFSTGLRYRVYQWDKILTLSIATDVALAKAAQDIYYGFDPRLIISHRRVTGKTTSMFFALSAGGALTHKDSGRLPELNLSLEDLQQTVEGDHTRIGPLISLAVGYGLKANQFLVFDATYRSNELQLSVGMGRDF